jgi:hypothetical protein
MICRVLAFVSLAALLAFPQTTAPASVDVSEEPKHHLAFQNDYVRAFEVEVPVGTETLVHRHTKPYMYVSIGDADVRNDVVGKDPVTIHPKDGEVKFVKGGFAHKAANVGNTDFRNVTVELLKTGPDLGFVEGRRPGLQNVGAGNGWVAETFSLSHGESTMVPNSTRNYALIAISDLDLTTSAERPSNPPIKMHAGEVAWFAGGVAQEWSNNAATPARYVILSMMPAENTPGTH